MYRGSNGTMITKEQLKVNVEFALTHGYRVFRRFWNMSDCDSGYQYHFYKNDKFYRSYDSHEAWGSIDDDGDCTYELVIIDEKIKEVDADREFWIGFDDEEEEGEQSPFFLFLTR